MIQVEISWVVMLCSVVGYKNFGWPCYLHLQSEVKLRGGSMDPRNNGILHCITTQKTSIWIFAVKTQSRNWWKRKVKGKVVPVLNQVALHKDAPFTQLSITRRGRMGKWRYSSAWSLKLNTTYPLLQMRYKFISTMYISCFWHMLRSEYLTLRLYSRFVLLNCRASWINFSGPQFQM